MDVADICMSTAKRVLWLFKNAPLKIGLGFIFIGLSCSLGAVKTELPLLNRTVKNENQLVSVSTAVQNLSPVPRGSWGWKTLFWPTWPQNHPSIIILFLLAAEMERKDNVVDYLLQETPMRAIGFGSSTLIPHSLPHLVRTTAPEVSGKKCN